MSNAVETLRPVSAGRLLTIWREEAEAEPDETVRGLICNARVLAECCFSEGEPTFKSPQAVLDALTPREMETLVHRLAKTGPVNTADGNPAFDESRFLALRRERE